MKKGVKLKPLKKSSVKIFKIANRRGYAAICNLNLTEGTTPYLTYYRMQKAVKRSGFCLPDIFAAAAKRLVRKRL
jgi:hypothetical protein